MQSYGSIHDFERFAPTSASTKRRLELQTELFEQQQQQQHQPQQQQQQQQQQQPLQEQEPVDEYPNKRQRPSMATNLLYKLTEALAYTSAVASEAYQTLTGGQIRPHDEYEPEYEPTPGSVFDQEYYEEIMQGSNDDAARHRDAGAPVHSPKQNAWVNNVVEEEPPPPYDSSWAMPVQPRVTQVTDMDAASSSTNARVQFETQSSAKQANGQKQRRPIRVRRNTRRPLRRKGSTQDMREATPGKVEKEEDIFLKFNCRLADMIAEGRAALTSTVDVTDVDVMLAEERDREDRIMRELVADAATPSGGRRRRMTGSSGEFDLYNSPVEATSYGSVGTHGSYTDAGGYSTVPRSSSPIASYGVGAGASHYSSYSPASAFATSPTKYGPTSAYPSQGASSYDLYRSPFESNANYRSYNASASYHASSTPVYGSGTHVYGSGGFGSPAVYNSNRGAYY